MRRRVFPILLFLIITIASNADLVGYWTFDENGGTVAADSSGNAYDAVFYAADGTHVPEWIEGRIGDSAVLLNDNTTGASNYNNLVIDANTLGINDPNLVDPNMIGLTNLGKVFTFSMWVRRDLVNTSPYVFPRLVHTNAYDLQLARYPEGNTGSNDPYDFLGWDGNSNYRINIGLTTAEQAVGNWYHLAVTSDGKTIRRYINGAEADSTDVPVEEMPMVTSYFYMGSMADGTSYFIGALDDVAIWAGTYLPVEEVEKLANETATPMTVEDVIPEPSLPPNYFTMESNNAWVESGWKLFYGPGFSTFTYWPGDNITLNEDNTASVWYIKDIEASGWPEAKMEPGGHYALWSTGQRHWYYFRDVTPDNYYGKSSRNVDDFGMAWVDPSWSGADPNVAKFAVYITPDIALFIQNNSGYQDPQLDWGKDYFKTYARVASVNGEGASVCVRSYSYEDDNNPLSDEEYLSIATDPSQADPNDLLLLGEVFWPLTQDDYQWQEMKYAYPKPPVVGMKVWTEISIVGGNENTRVYIDEFNPISDEANTSQHDASYYAADINTDAIVNSEDMLVMADGWLAAGVVTEPRNTGMLFNGDFFEDINRFGTNNWISESPADWQFSGTGDSGIQRMDQTGLMNSYMVNTPAPLGGSVAAYVIDDAVLSQTTVQNAVVGQTYYAMAYVMTNSWAGWKDIATLTLSINGTEAASFSRPMSLNCWRPVYGTYTATAQDAGKPITVQVSYADAQTDTPGYMYVGYVYLDTVMPSEWPEGRDNLLVNGGFEDLSDLEADVPPGVAAIANSIKASDNWGAWFVDGVPAPPSWIYEVPSGFSLDNEGGLFASGQMGSPIPTPGMNDVSIYASQDLILGQVVGALSNGVTYYLDMACGVVIEPTEWGSYNTAWPNPAPQFHLELWQIPAGVTDGDTIHAGITTSQPGYVKIAEAVEAAFGDIKGGAATPPASRWQLIGTTYTATSSDSNVYVRIYGTNAVPVTHPSFAFSDVYLSTEKRLVPGGDFTFQVGAGLQYDSTGAYTCYHAGLLGLEAPEGDINGDCMVNMVDLSIMAGNWIQNWFNNITGAAPWE